MDEFFEKARPEELGIPSASIINFLQRLETLKVPMHSFLLMRHGKMVVETYYAPFNEERMHRMFSITKSFVSLAIGCLEQEGKLSLDDSIVKYFPEKQPDNGPHPLLMMTTIRDMLRMASPHDKTTFKQIPSDDWVRTFFIAEPTHIPGTTFAYDTSASHTLTALVEKLSGMSLLEYLRSKFLDKIGFSKEAYTLKDPMGITMGGSGLVCTPRDVMPVMKLVADKGVYNGEQLIPQEYLELAVSKQICNIARGETSEEKYGYGYQFWMTREGGYAAYGMGGQYAVYLPKKDILYVTTADTQGLKGGTQQIYDAFFEEIYDKVSDKGAHRLSEAVYTTFDEFIASRKLMAVIGRLFSDTVHFETDKTYTYQMASNAQLFSTMLIRFASDEGNVTFVFKDAVYDFRFGLGRNIMQRLSFVDLDAAVSAAWIDDNTLLISAQMIDAYMGNILVELCFQDSYVTVVLIKHEESLFAQFNGSFYGKLEENA